MVCQGQFRVVPRSGLRDRVRVDVKVGVRASFTNRVKFRVRVRVFIQLRVTHKQRVRQPITPNLNSKSNMQP